MLPSDVLSGYTKALYSSWYLYRPDRILVDCGEGCATALGNKIFGVEKVFLTHGHIDHVGGLPTLMWTRASAMGDNEKPLQIFYPEGDNYLQDLRAYVEKVRQRISYPLEWCPLRVGEEVELKSNRVLKTFPTRHMKDSQSLGFQILETRRRVRAEWAHEGESQLRERAQNGTLDEVMESYRAPLVAFCGDSLPVEADHVRGSEMLLHEATILDAGERKGQSHSTLDEAVGAAIAAQTKLLVLTHISGRYKRADVQKALDESVARRASKTPVSFPIWCFLRDRLICLYEPPSA